MKTKLFITLTLVTLLSGCPLEGDNGNTGATGATGATGESGINCWDLNGNRVNDNDEDVNKDGLWDAYDCAVAASSAQNQTVELNHQHICEALANLGQYPEGCPSAVHTTPTGTLTKMTTSTFFDDGTGNKFESCAYSPSNGLLSISLRDFVNKDGDTVKQGWYELEGGYIVNRATMPTLDAAQGACQDQCGLDQDCIASFAFSISSDASECRLFYHSDTVVTFEQLCGLDAPGFSASQQCFAGLGNIAIWASRCP